MLFSFVSGFHNGWLLWGSVAIAIPIILFLWRRRHVREIPFAPIEFVIAASKSMTRRNHLAQFILLAIRALLLLVLVLAIAGPIENSGNRQANPTTPRTHWIFVIDDSFSMQYLLDQVTLLERAKHRATELIDSTALGDGFSILTLSYAPTSVLEQPTTDRAAAKRALQSLSIRQQAARLRPTLERLSALVERNSSGQQWQQQRVVFVSDFCQNTWRELRPAEGPSLLEPLSSMADFQFEPMAPNTAPNVAVSRLDSNLLRPTVGQSIQLNVGVDGYQLPEPQTVQLRLYINGKQLQQQSMVVQSEMPNSANFELTISEPGPCTIEVRASADSLRIDDRRRLVVEARSHARLLCVEDYSGISRSMVATLQTELGSPVFAVQPTVIELEDLSSIDLSQFDAVVLCNVKSPSEHHASALIRFARQGGGVLLMLGDRTDVKQWRQAWSGEEAIGIELDDIRPVGRYRFEPGNYEHAIIAPFRGFERAGLLDVPIWRYVKFSSQVPSAETALQFDTGDPAIISITVGKGRVVFFAGAATSPNAFTRWSVLDAWWSFVPLVNEMLQWVCAGAPSVKTVSVGDTIGGTFGSHPVRTRLKMTLPDGSVELVRSNRRDDIATWHFGPVRHSGFFRLTSEPNVEDEQVYAVNVATPESDTRTIDVQSLVSLQRAPASAGATAPVAEDVSSVWIAGILLMAFLLLLVLESLAAWFLTRQKHA